MTENDLEPPYHLLLSGGEVTATAKALRMLVSDEAHEPRIRELAREVLAELDDTADERGILSVTLHSQQMKITHTALRLLFNDLGREQADELETLRAVLDKLPDEHTMRAITID